ncbi:hypothetical protein SDC9_200022 [bioreactor metagenome]|uniref:Uncharacterized protein n=1 Tax=bioreactor metagenome TaxID=1076179 RepID=A0A645IM37_9ZZZZ
MHSHILLLIYNIVANANDIPNTIMTNSPKLPLLCTVPLIKNKGRCHTAQMHAVSEVAIPKGSCFSNDVCKIYRHPSSSNPPNKIISGMHKNPT